MKNQKKLKTKQRHNKANGIDIPGQHSSGGGNNSFWDWLNNKKTQDERIKAEHRAEEYLKRHPK